MNNPPLGKIKVAAPCKAEWKWMYGDDRVRFCGQCSRNVFNLSALTTREAEDLILRAEGRLCVRFYRRRDGSILTQNCPVGLQTFREKLTSTRTHLIAAILSFLGYLGVLGLPGRPVMGSPVMGDIAGGGIECRAATAGQREARPGRAVVSRTEAFIRQSAIFKVIPIYHSAVKNRAAHGLVTVSVTIDETGSVARAECLGCDSSIKELAEEAARQWKFVPISVDRQPVRVESSLTFRLPN